MTDQIEQAAQPLIGAALAKLQGGDARAALAMLLEAQQKLPASLGVKLNLALAYRTLADYPGALRALNAALAIDPYCFLALLSKGMVLEQMGRPRVAAETYRNALKIAPPPDQIPPSLQAPINRAKTCVAEQAAALALHLRHHLGGLRTQLSGESRGRFEECLDVLAGTQQVFHAEPVQLHVPRLPAIPFFEREYFPWLGQLEAATDRIRSELLALLEAGMPGFAPYVQYPPGTPENQFAPLNNSQLWSSLWLWRDGAPQAEPLARCPETAAVLAALPLADQPGFAPTAVFSALAPRTRIPPHTGSTNSRLLVHLPLVLPGPAGFRVGNETREWRMGEAWVFDDTIEHEAWNDANETRVILIFDIWNPLLSATERELISAMLREHRQWLAQPATA